MPDDEFIIVGSPAVLRGLHDAFRDDGDALIVSISGDLSALRRLVVKLHPEKAELLSRALGAAISIEPNQDVFPA